VALELEVEKVDQYGRISAYVWLPDDSMFNEVLLSEGDAQVATFPPTSSTSSGCKKPRGRRIGGCGHSLRESSASRRIGATR
jgi:endonuclease YncB( thermonuclease family)